MKVLNRNSGFVRFILVGILNTAFGYSIYLLLIYFNVHFTIAAFISTVLGILFNFKTTGNYVFNSNNDSLFIRFLSVYGVLYLINISGIKIFHYMNISYAIGGALMIAPMAILGFLLNKKFVFNHD